MEDITLYGDYDSSSATILDIALEICDKTKTENECDENFDAVTAF